MRSGCLDLKSSLKAKFGARSSEVHQIRGKTWEVLLPQLRTQKLGKNTNLGVISRIQRTKFEVIVTYIFGGKIWAPIQILEANFGAKVPRPPNMEVPPGLKSSLPKCLDYDFQYRQVGITNQDNNTLNNAAPRTTTENETECKIDSIARALSSKSELSWSDSVTPILNTALCTCQLRNRKLNPNCL